MDTCVEVASIESVFESLAHERRRHVVRCLAAAGESMSVRTLAREVARHERDEADSGPLSAATEAVHVALSHQHLPKLAAADTVAFDRERDHVSLTVEGEEAERVLAFASEGDSEY